MELDDTEIIYCSSDSSDSVIEIIDDIDITNNEFKYKDKLEDDVIVNEKEKQTLLVDTMLSSEKLSTNSGYSYDDDDDDDDDDDEPWAVEEDSSDSDLASLLSNIECGKINENNPNTSETDRKILIANRKLNNSSSVGIKTFGSDKTEDKDIETETETYLPTAKKIKPLQVSNEKVDINSESNINNFEKDKKSLNDKQDCNIPSSNINNLIETTAFSGPSCSKDLPGISSLSTHTDIKAILEKEHQSKLLFNFYNKSFLNGKCFTPLNHELEENIEINQGDIKISPLEECEIVKNVLKSTTLENCNEDSQTIESEGFVEEPNIINSDIMYNIDLNEHLSQMDLLVQKIEKTPNDPTLLEECLQLMPIPQIEHEPKTYTIEERTNFLNGISEWEYDIDREDWNKIMVKCAVVFTAHAGFSIANEESLYVLAEVAIDHIKKLAVIMKNNFDIQSRSSYPDKIDPINNSLQEVGVEGGVKELIKHFENDVFSRQNRLIKKCQHYQKIIDQYVENMITDSAVKNQYVTKENTKEDNLNSQKFMKKDESSVLGEKNIEMENTLEEVATDIQQTLEFNIDNLLLTEDNPTMNTEMEQTEHTYLEKSNVEIKKNETENKTVAQTDKKTFNINLLKPIITEPIDYNPESILYKTQENIIDLESQKRPNLFSDKSIFNIEGFGQPDITEPPTENDLFEMKNKKITELITLQNLMEGLCQSESEVSSKRALKIKKALDDFDEDFKQHNASQIKTDLSNFIDLDDPCFNVFDHFTLPQRESIINDGASTSKEDFHDMSFLNPNDNVCSNTDLDSFIDGLLNKL